MGEYPGEGYKMSMYGTKHYTPVQKSEQWTQNVQREEKVRKGHGATGKQTEKEDARHEDLKATGKLPTEKTLAYFNSVSEVDKGNTYDKIYHTQPGFNQMQHRDDRSHFDHPVADRSEEEKAKSMPTLSSSVYGRRPPLELPSRNHVRVEMMRHTFYRPRGLNMDSSE